MENETDWLNDCHMVYFTSWEYSPSSSHKVYVGLQTNILSHLHPELPHATHRHPGNGAKVVGGYDGALLGATHTRHTLHRRKQEATLELRTPPTPPSNCKIYTVTWYLKIHVIVIVL